jgi:hypothetical protein
VNSRLFGNSYVYESQDTRYSLVTQKSHIVSCTFYQLLLPSENSVCGNSYVFESQDTTHYLVTQKSHTERSVLRRTYMTSFMKILVQTLDSLPPAPRREVAANAGFLPYPVFVHADACIHNRELPAGGRSVGYDPG